ncbi:AAA-domain-containing protein [Linderina pennispora]|uniref:AAA-domain-containing protein n=1 Tax=Linderina pennispora TaxID=61395 RepID=A0A1Y1W094_9FUNG|nr:AAA-domain-containing protein [Linderina pennispora]ORX66923.1 AAA-domain-containing protein [Linderina pennispora]
MSDDLVPGYNDVAAGLSAEVRSYFASHQHYRQLNTQPMQVIFVHGTAGVGKSAVIKSALQSLPYPVINSSLGDIVVTANGAAAASVIVLDRVDVLADRDLTQEIGKLGMQFLQFTQSLPPSVFMILESTRPATSMPASIKRSIVVQHALEIPVPTRPRREKIVQYAVAKYSRTEGGTEPGDSSLISRIARATAGYVARDLCNLCRQAYLRMLRADNGLRNAMLDARLIVRPSQQLEFECALPTKTWADIGGYGPVKSMLQRFMKLATSETSSRLGIKPPTGVLLHGPTGCGKTAMALAMIADSSCNVICIRGSELFSKYLGETEARLRRLFQAAQACSPWSSVESGGPGLRVLSTLLNEMDGVHETRGVIAVGCTNQIDKIDDAILRPGRFDQLVHVGMPALEDRAGIVQTLARNSPLEADVRMDELARLTSDYSGAELEQLFREAGLAAMRSDADAIALSMEDFMDALDKVDDNQQ